MNGSHIISQLWSKNINKEKRAEFAFHFELGIGQQICSLHVGNWATMDDFFLRRNIRNNKECRNER